MAMEGTTTIYLPQTVPLKQLEHGLDVNVGLPCSSLHLHLSGYIYLLVWKICAARFLLERFDIIKDFVRGEFDRPVPKPSDSYEMPNWCRT